MTETLPPAAKTRVWARRAPRNRPAAAPRRPAAAAGAQVWSSAAAEPPTENAAFPDGLLNDALC